MTHTERLTSYLAIAAALLLGYTLGHRTPAAIHGGGTADTDTIRAEYTTAAWRTDTLIIPDTIRLLATRTVKVAVHDTVHRTDTLTLPAEQREYHGDNWRVWASGVGVQLDSISVRTDTIHLTQTITNTIERKPRRLTIGLQAGYGLTPKGLTPYIGAGVSYRLTK